MQHEYIRKAVESACEQDYKNIEIIVSDDSESAETEDALADFIADGVITYYRNNPRLGRVRNYHDSLRFKCRGDWVLNLDGDDFLVNPSFISNCIEIVLKHPEVAYVFGKEYKYLEYEDRFEERICGLSEERLIDGTELFQNKRKLGVNFYHLSSLFNREKAINRHFYTYDCLGCDTLSILGLILGHKVYFLNQFGGAWRVHSENDSFPSEAEKLVGNVLAIKQLRELASEHLEENITNDWIADTQSNRTVTYIIHYLQQRNYKLALELSKRIAQSDPRLKKKIFFSPRNYIKFAKAIIFK